MPYRNRIRPGRKLLGACHALLWCGCVAPALPDTSPDGDGNSPATDAVGLELPFVENELLVQPFPGVDAATLLTLYEQAGATIHDELPEIEVTVLRMAPTDLVAAETHLVASGLLETVQKNFLYEPELTPSDTMFGSQTHLPQIGAVEAWEVSTGNSAVRLAIVDTGVDAGHTDLAGRIADGWNAYDKNSDFEDVLGHGTLVAGVAGALSNNAFGVAGVAWDCPQLAVRATDSKGRASGRHLAAGILWSLGHEAKVINVSFAPLWTDKVVQSAAQTAWNRGSLVIIAAGNAGGSNSAAGYTEAVFVGAIDGLNQAASFSDRGPFVDLVAPGMGIRSTERGGTFSYASGTSFSAPIVAGVAALAWSANPTLRPVTIEGILSATATDLGAIGKDMIFGNGAVNAAAAVEEAQRTAFVPDIVAPTIRVVRPANNASLVGRTTVAVTASDDYGVADVVMSVDGVPHAADIRAPFEMALDTAHYAPGAHVLSFVATDAAGNASLPATVVAVFAAATSGGSRTQIRFTSPKNGASVSGDVTIQASVSDTDGLATVEWLVDGESAFVGTLSGRSSGLSYRWRTAGVSPGRHVIVLAITDARGNRVSGDLELVVR